MEEKRGAGLINGKQSLTCPHGFISIARVWLGDCWHSPELKLQDFSGKIVWRAILDGLEDDSTSPWLASGRCDFRATLFSSGKLLLMAGNNKAVSVDLALGKVLAEGALRQTYSSLDVLIVQETPTGLGVAASAGRVVIFTNAGLICAEIDLPGLLTSVLSIGPNEIAIRRYDGDDPLLPEIEETINFDTNEKRTSTEKNTTGKSD